MQLESLLSGLLPAHFVSSSRSIPQLALKRILGKFQSLVRLRTRLAHLQVQVLAHTAGAISLRTPARALFVLFSKSIPKAPKQILGKI